MTNKRNKERFDGYVQAAFTGLLANPECDAQNKPSTFFYEIAYNLAKGMIEYADTRYSEELPFEKDDPQWIKNTGVQPTADDTIVDVVYQNGLVNKGIRAGVLFWGIERLKFKEFGVTHWRIADSNTDSDTALNK